MERKPRELLPDEAMETEKSTHLEFKPRRRENVNAPLKQNLYRDRQRKKGRGGGGQHGSNLASPTDPHGSSGFAPQLPHLGKLLVKGLGKTDLTTMLHPLPPRGASPHSSRGSTLARRL